MNGLVGTALFPDVFASLREVVECRQVLVFLGQARVPGAQLDDWHREDSGTLPNAVPAEDPRIRELGAGIADLPAAERLALVLHYLEGLSDAEIGELLGADPASAMRLRASALGRIAKAS